MSVIAIICTISFELVSWSLFFLNRKL